MIAINYRQNEGNTLQAASLLLDSYYESQQNKALQITCFSRSMFSGLYAGRIAIDSGLR